MENVPAALIHDGVLPFLDAASLGRLGATSRSWRDQVASAPAWRTCLQRQFGVRLDVYGPCDPTLWQPMMASLVADAREIRHSVHAKDVLAIAASKAPMLPVSGASIRREIVLMQGLRRFPTDADLIAAYARAIRQQLQLVQI
ncbi:hypothetical protein SPRG_00891 [Saprolegnia parasitica CBS 223.65]|uniref:F-box domain-containing protein n=1 Tax=Saprolegnia parasitica (strain CBS 223.65) TaxID=695850 RepID=A0A067CZZ3_SAPPC|nr:hypothetical protein SPRG_00891 [Saprolegnia parasitica CBS 223.65]KDO34830.1 hypothetical protein SPRG_00891 [Saprolegnia parasitica CBS 223.65]|eukprot:XP_012194494.1 hypothetical protein SPRG_00891 [Saprolegnia parasitica CBS 223.65]